jgi:hypothetical protein
VLSISVHTIGVTKASQLMHNVIVYVLILFVHLLPDMFRQVTQLTYKYSNTLLLDTVDLIRGMSHNTNLAITSNRDARPKKTITAKNSTRSVPQKTL